jgi:hypothetical protein
VAPSLRAVGVRGPHLEDFGRTGRKLRDFA